MGYRSEVAIAIKSEDYRNYFEGVEVLKGIFTNALVQENKNLSVVIIHFSEVKWNSNYEDVALIENIFEHMTSEGHPYAFVRIGEYSNDIETYSFEGENEEYLDEYIYPVAYISTPTDEDFELI